MHSATRAAQRTTWTVAFSKANHVQYSAIRVIALFISGALHHLPQLHFLHLPIFGQDGHLDHETLQLPQPLHQL